MEDASIRVVARIADFELESSLVHHLGDESETGLAFLREWGIVGEDWLVLAAQTFRGDDSDFSVGLEGRLNSLECVGKVLETQVASKAVILDRFREHWLVEGTDKVVLPPKTTLVNMTPTVLKEGHRV